MLGPKLRDIDKVVELDDKWWDDLQGAGGPQKAISLIYDALAPHLPGARFEAKKHALAITLPDSGFNFDAVPAFNPEDRSSWIHIADTEDDRWEPSNSYILIDTITVRNQQCDGRFVREVRMVKQAVHNAGLSDVLPGLHVETFTYHAVSAAVDHPDAVAATLMKGVELLGTGYYDPTGTDLISNRLSQAAVATAKNEIQRLAGRAAEAQRLAADGKETAAARIWAEIFGDPFSPPSRPTRRPAYRASTPGPALPQPERPPPVTLRPPGRGGPDDSAEDSTTSGGSHTDCSSLAEYCRRGRGRQGHGRPARPPGHHVRRVLRVRLHASRVVRTTRPSRSG